MPSFVTRRRFLVGGALVAAGAAGAALAGEDLHPRRWWDAVTGGCGDAGPVPPPSPEAPSSGSFASATLGLDVGFAIAMPPGHRVGDTLPFAIMLPGKGATADAAMASTRFADFVADAVGRGERPFALAAVDGGSSYWHARASGEDRMAMLIDEFIPLCRDRFGLGEDRLAVMGWSMGGYGALLAAASHPELFVGVAAASPAIWRSYEEMDDAVGDAFDGPGDYERFDVFGMTDALGTMPVRIDCGTADPFYANDPRSPGRSRRHRKGSGSRAVTRPHRGGWWRPPRWPSSPTSCRRMADRRARGPCPPGSCCRRRLRATGR